jgi:hypothetical protein
VEKFVMHNTYLMFDNKVFKQIQGTAMGSSAAVAFACLFMADIEDPWIEKFQSKLLLFNRFIDDGFGVFLGTEDEAKLALTEYNQLHPKITIEFATSDSSVNFLDLTLYLSTDRKRIHARCFQKEMNKYLYLPFTSYHNNHLKRNFIRGDLIRYIRNCSEERYFDKLRANFFSRLRARGYPANFLFPIFLNVQYSQRQSFLQQSPNNSSESSFSNSTFLIMEKNQISSKLDFSSFFNNNWFTHTIPISDQSEEATFLKSLPKPIILTKYPPNIRQLLIRSELNGFTPKPKNRFQIYNSPKQLPDPLDEHRQKRFKPPPKIFIKRASPPIDPDDDLQLDPDQQIHKKPKPHSKL